MAFGKSSTLRSKQPGTSTFTNNDHRESMTAVSPNFYFGAGDPVAPNTSGELVHSYTAVCTTSATTTQIAGVAQRAHMLGTWATTTTTATYTTTAAYCPFTELDSQAGWWIAAGTSTATGNSSTTTAASFVVSKSYSIAYDQIGSSGPYAVFANAQTTVAATSVATTACVTVLALDTKNNLLLVRPSVIIRHPIVK